jgi:UrcA family protein
MNTTANAKGFRRLSATALCGVVASSALTAAVAGFAPLKARVEYGDLDVSRPQGAAVLFGRIQSAAEKVCSPFEASGFAAKTHSDACINKAISKAVTTVDAPALSRVYSEKRGRPCQPAWSLYRAAEDQL